ncbi:hypothetical protein RND81_13G074800 [Saponaria officinalis]|uniref:DUF8039 domain-containing protein n=1 Tax=Saponaria officinalis TaxID=3572 RepID=A0AAW1GXU9_SAPOF
MNLAVRNNVSSVLQEMGLSTMKQLDDVVNGGNQKCPGHAENDTSLRLFLKDPHNGVAYEVARGKAFPGELCHQGFVGSDQVRIKLSIVPQEFESLPLPIPVPAYDLHILKDAVGSIVLWPIELVRVENEKDTRPSQVEVMGSNSHHSKLSTTPIKAPNEELIVESLSPDYQWLNKLVGTMVDEDRFTIYFEADLYYYNKDGETKVYEYDLRQFLKGCELNISIIQIFIRALQDDLVKASTQPRIGWLCPDATSDAKLIKKMENAIVYITNAFHKSSLNGHEFILAPIIDSKHWLLLAICPQVYTIYEFDSVALKDGRKFSLRRFKMTGGKIKVQRKEPLWKSIKVGIRIENDLKSGTITELVGQDCQDSPSYSAPSSNQTEEVRRASALDTLATLAIGSKRKRIADSPCMSNEETPKRPAKQEHLKQPGLTNNPPASKRSAQWDANAYCDYHRRRGHHCNAPKFWLELKLFLYE